MLYEKNHRIGKLILINLTRGATSVIHWHISSNPFRNTLTSSLQELSVNYETLEQQLQRLPRIARGKVLKTVTLVFCGERLALEKLLYMRELTNERALQSSVSSSQMERQHRGQDSFDLMLGTLHRYFRLGGSLAYWGVSCKIMMQCHWTRELYGQRAWMRMWAGSMEMLKETVELLHWAAGGELYMDGILTFKNRNRVANLFPLRPLAEGVAERGGVRPEDVGGFPEHKFAYRVARASDYRN